MKVRTVWIWLIAGLLVACDGREPDATVPPTIDRLNAATANPDVARTLQADAAETAAGVADVDQFATPTEEPFPTAADAVVEGVAPSTRTGLCEGGDDFLVHQREGFCLSAPALWTVFNVDGGLASALNTTPGKAITLQPDWAENSGQCSFLMYVAVEDSVNEHLNTRFFTFASRGDVIQLTNVTLRDIGGLALRGFSWSLAGGNTGSVYAALLGPNQLLHISFTGANCPKEAIEPIIATIRFGEEDF